MNMGYFKKISIGGMVYAMVVLLLGCCSVCAPRRHTPYRVIAEIQVVYQNQALETRQQFTQPEKLQRIVDYLRRIDPYGTPIEAPETVAGSDFYITLLYSDGSQRRYHQRADRYMRVEQGAWKRIDPDKALELSRLLGSMPSDNGSLRLQ